MRLALFQLDACSARGGEEGLWQVETLLRRADEAGATLAHLPELALPGYGAGLDTLRREAERAPETMTRLAGLVNETDVALAFGLPLIEDGAVRNAAVLFTPERAPVVYAKRFLYGDYERAAFEPGRVPSPIVSIGAMRIGLLVCFDVEFPETVRELALAGVDLVLVPTALPASAGARFIARSLVPTRAFENGVFVSYADWCGSDVNFGYQGLSAIAAPDGTFLAQAGDAEATMLVADLDPAAFAEARAANDYLREVRAAGL